jgi:hypothetical protein
MRHDLLIEWLPEIIVGVGLANLLFVTVFRRQFFQYVYGTWERFHMPIVRATFPVRWSS